MRVAGHVIDRTRWIGAAAANDWLASAVADLIAPPDAASTGVYLSTVDAGGDAAVAFWQRACAETVALASPQEFPLTLASSAATHLALVHGLLGPNQTLVGGVDASRDALADALADIERGIVSRALVVRFIAGGPADDTRVHGLAIVGTGDVADDLATDGDDPIVAACKRRLARNVAGGATRLETMSDQSRG